MIKKDMKGQKHKGCRGGRFEEAGIQDDMHGTLHCTKCGIVSDRHVTQGLKEITGTCDGFRYLEHIYLLNEAGKMYGYIKEGESEPTIFSKPMHFEKKYRKFELVNV